MLKMASWRVPGSILEASGLDFGGFWRGFFEIFHHFWVCFFEVVAWQTTCQECQESQKRQEPSLHESFPWTSEPSELVSKGSRVWFPRFSTATDDSLPLWLATTDRRIPDRSVFEGLEHQGQAFWVFCKYTSLKNVVLEFSGEPWHRFWRVSVFPEHVLEGFWE